ncbi:methyltransferase type 11 [Parathielavia appendiculata]|uniref:Methyltransferase type 11 n=1 Tax=Parathielavia appendiculata TaxID=2587402 RepID=A0AAN6Z4K4_9PEZI|nr:methyltransferase type 11 [Parathielavia appendiculata]
MSDNPMQIVSQGYDHIAESYLHWVESQRSPREHYTEKLLSHCPPSPRILELGCGAGVPITRMLLDRGAQVVANDISAKQLDLARARCPEAALIPGDMTALSFEPESFDGVVAFFSIFHLPRAEQKGMFSKIHSWLKPGGMVVFNLATADEEEVYGEFLGHGMFWSSFGAEESKAMVTDVGLKVVEFEELEAGDGQVDENDPDYGVSFIWVAARKGLVL